MNSAIEYIKYYQAWRQRKVMEQPALTVVSIKLDAVILAAERYERLRKLPLIEFQKIYTDNMRGAKFDAQVGCL
jgi:hypothetical protein